MIRVTRQAVDMLANNVRDREWLEQELGIRSTLRAAEPVVRVDSARKLAEIASVTGSTMQRLGAARRVKYGGVIFQSFESDKKGR